MENVINPSEERGNLVVPEPVGVGNKSHGHRVVN